MNLPGNPARSRPLTFSSVLIANRGEIAIRIARACRAHAIRSIAVYSDADRDAPHVAAADEAVYIGPTPAAESYLSIEQILAAARHSGAEAIHPGYGFLSERAEFARAVSEAGLVFVGPSADVMDSMGRKDHARAIAERAGVPVTPRYDPAGVPDDAFPVLVKAAAGGGGKGMRIVRDPAELGDAIDAATREAASAFGDETVLIEKYIEGGRHVEVQVMADHHGNVVAVGERDCSAQRRHQKVVEESPAPTITSQLRELLAESSKALCRQVGYTNAGTVEFLVAGDEAHFLEMNTRLQVEHPVTEAVWDVDLVSWQLAIAAGERLPQLPRSEPRGHAIEVRVYAEDPYAGFLPQAGTAGRVVWPAHVRVDEAFNSGQSVSTAYDPMLAKIIAYGHDRDDARRRLVRALDATAVFGVTTNIGFLRRLIAADAFGQCRVHTAWLDGPEAAELVKRPDMPEDLGQIAAGAWARDTVQSGDDPFGSADGWRLAGEPADPIVRLTDPGGITHTYRARIADADGAIADVSDQAVHIAWHGQSWTFTLPDPKRAGSGVDVSDSEVVSPMPGTVLAVDVDAGQTVESGQRLGVIEAMKMEIALTAPYAGVVGRVAANQGASVALGDVLFAMEEP